MKSPWLDQNSLLTQKQAEVWCLCVDLSQPTLERSVPSLRILTVILFEERVFSFRLPLLTSESTNTVLWEEAGDAVKSTKLWGQDDKAQRTAWLSQ